MAEKNKDDKNDFDNLQLLTYIEGQLSIRKYNPISVISFYLQPQLFR